MNKEREDLIKNFSETYRRSKEDIKQLFEICDWNEFEVLQLIELNKNPIDLFARNNQSNQLNKFGKGGIFDDSDSDEVFDYDQINQKSLNRAQDPKPNFVNQYQQKQKSLVDQKVSNVENDPKIPNSLPLQQQQSNIANEVAKSGKEEYDHYKELEKIRIKKEKERNNLSLDDWDPNYYSKNNQQGIDQSEKKVQQQPPLPQSNLNKVQNNSQQNQSNINNNLGPKVQVYDNPGKTSQIQNDQKIPPPQNRNVIPNPNFQQPNEKIANPQLQEKLANEQQNQPQVSKLNPLFKSAPSQSSQVQNNPQNQKEQNKKIEVVPQMNQQQTNGSNRKQSLPLNEQIFLNKNQIDKQSDQNLAVAAYFKKINSITNQPLYQILEILRNLKDEDIDISSIINQNQIIQNSDENQNFYPIGLKNEQQQSSFNCILQLIFRNPILIKEILNSYKKDSDNFVKVFNFTIASLIWKMSNSSSDVSDLLEETYAQTIAQLGINQQQDYFKNQNIIDFFENLILQIDLIYNQNKQISKKFERFQNQTLINQYQASRLGSQLQYISYIELDRSDRFFYVSLIKEIQKNSNFSALPANLIFSIQSYQQNQVDADSEKVIHDYWFPTETNLQFLKIIDQATPIISYLKQSSTKINQINECIENLNALNFVANTYLNQEVIYQDVVNCLENEIQVISDELMKLYPKNFKKINKQFNKDLPDWYFLQAIVIQIDSAVPNYYIYIFSFMDNRWQKFDNETVVYIPHNQVMKDAQKNACMLVYVSKEQKIKISEYEENLKAIFLDIKQKEKKKWKSLFKKHPLLQHKIFKEIFSAYEDE